MRKPKQTEQRVQLRIDWRAYYREFCDAHGGIPVEHGGRQLFEDGWTYSLTDYRGPEWPPPADARELLALKIEYWNIRLKAVLAQRDRLAVLLRDVEQLMLRRSCPLQQRVTYVDEAGKRQTQTGPLDVEPLRARHELFCDDVAYCEDKLNQLRAEQRAALPAEADDVEATREAVN